MKWPYVTCGLALIVVFGLYKCDTASRQEAHQVMRARMDVANVAQALSKMALFYPNTLSHSTLSNLDSSSLYRLLRNTNGTHETTFLMQSKWDSQRSLTDQWGRPLRIRVLFRVSDRAPEPIATATVKIWSDGPNKTNDDGIGDDICTSVNVDVCD